MNTSWKKYFCQIIQKLFKNDIIFISAKMCLQKGLRVPVYELIKLSVCGNYNRQLFTLGIPNRDTTQKKNTMSKLRL